MMEKVYSTKSGTLTSLLKPYIGHLVFLNADNLNPYTLEKVNEDHLILLHNTTKKRLILSFSGIASFQRLEGIDGLIIYLIRSFLKHFS